MISYAVVIFDHNESQLFPLELQFCYFWPATCNANDNLTNTAP